MIVCIYIYTYTCMLTFVGNRTLLYILQAVSVQETYAIIG